MASLFELFVGITGDNSSYKKAVKGAQSDTTEFGKVTEAVTGKIGDMFGSLGLKLSAAGIGAAILKVGSDFQDAGNQISRVTGDVGANLDSLNSSLKTLYAGSARPLDELAAGLAKVRVETKLNGEALESLTEANLRFAKVTNSDLAASVDQTQRLFQNWGVSTADQSDALDVMYAIMTKAGMGASELASQMTEMGPTARAFGLSFVDTAALVGAFDDAGLRASEMVKGLNALFIKFAAAGKDPKQALAELIDRLRDTKTQAAAVNELIENGFAKRAAVAMADAAKRGALNIKDYQDAASNAKGKVKEVADQTTSLSDELKKLGHEAGIAADGLGGPLVHALTEVLKKARELNTEFQNSAAGKWLSVIAGIYKMGSLGGALGAASAGSSPASVSGAPSGVSGGLTQSTSGSGADLSARVPEEMDKFKPFDFADKSTENAILVRTIEDEESAKKKLLEEIVKLREHIAKGDPLTGAPDAPFGIDLAKLDTLQASLSKITGVTDTTADAFHRLGMKTPKELEDIADSARTDYEAIKNSGIASAEQLDEAFVRYKLKQIELDHALGDTDDELYAKQKQNAEETLKRIQGSTDAVKSHVKTIGDEIQRLNRRMFDDMSRGIADSIVEWKGKWSDSVKAIFKDLAKDLLQIVFKSLLSPLQNALGKALGGIFGGAAGAGGSAIGGIGSAVGGAASAGGGLASSAGSVASSGISGIVGMATGAVSAISGVIGNFQMRGMNKSLDLIEHNTRYSALYLNEIKTGQGALPADAWKLHEQILAKFDYLADVTARAIGGGGGGGGYNFTNCTFSAGVDMAAIVRSLKAAGY